MIKLIKKILIISILMGVVVAEVLYVMHPSQYEKLNSVRQHHEKIHRNNIDLERKNNKMKKAIESLQSCGNYCEQVARDELGMIKEGEKIYILPR
jgi:cell division protein FtsB